MKLLNLLFKSPLVTPTSSFEKSTYFSYKEDIPQRVDYT